MRGSEYDSSMAVGSSYTHEMYGNTIGGSISIAIASNHAHVTRFL